MTWQEFLNQQAGKRRLSSEETQILLKALPDENTKNSQAKISSEIHTGVDNVKAHLQSIYDKFQDVCDELANHKGAGKLEKLRTYLKEEYHNNQSEATVTTINTEPIYSEFQSLITEKTQSFCGREFVFAAFKNFIKEHKKGYFIVEGYAGIGKTSLCCQYISVENSKAIFYFCSANTENPLQDFKKNISKQIIDNFCLRDAKDDNLNSLLAKASHTLNNDDYIVIVIDGIDEIKQDLKDGQNVLYLPGYLPDKVYFFITRQPYDLGIKNPLYIYNVPRYDFDINSKDYIQFNSEDIKDLFSYYFGQDENKKILNEWMIKYKIDQEYFIQSLVQRTDNNFYCFKTFIQSILNGKYEDPSFNTIPQTLKIYYEKHWTLMDINSYTDPNKQIKRSILFIIVNYRGKYSLEEISELLKKDECDVELILKYWAEFLIKEKIEERTYYKIYHKCFLDFLKSKTEMGYNSNKDLADILNKLEETVINKIQD